MKKQAHLGTRTGSLTSGNFSYYMGPIAHWGFGVTGGVGAFIWMGLPDGLLNYWTPATKRARLSTRTGLITSGNFSYYMGPVARWVSGVTGGRGHLFGRVCTDELLNYWAPVKIDPV